MTSDLAAIRTELEIIGSADPDVDWKVRAAALLAHIDALTAKVEGLLHESIDHSESIVSYPRVRRILRGEA